MFNELVFRQVLKSRKVAVAVAVAMAVAVAVSYLRSLYCTLVGFCLLNVFVFACRVYVIVVYGQKRYLPLSVCITALLK